MSTLIVILIISFLVIIHELGHFIAARKSKVNVEEFGLGYPPKIKTLFTWRGTKFTLNAIPFGGFVRLEGEQGPEPDEIDQIQIKKNKWGPFYTKTAWQRLKIILAGVVVNTLFAVAAFAAAFTFLGIPREIPNQVRIGTVEPDSPAAQASLPEEVNILELRTDQQTYQIETIQDVQQAVEENRGQTLTVVATTECEGLTCPEETQEFDVYARTEEETPANQGSLGIVFKEAVFVHYPWYQMIFRGSWFGIKQSVALGVLIIRALTDMFVRLIAEGQVPTGVAGPVGIIDQTQQGNIITRNFWEDLGFSAMLSLNLAIMNLLPIPALDGGRAVFILLERLLGKKKVQKIEPYANYVGFALLILLIIAITVNDIGRIIQT